MWDGSTWNPMGSGISSGQVNAIAVSGPNVYVGGAFTSIGGVSANNIAVWNGSTWSALGAGTNSDVYTLAISGSNIYVGGQFTTAGGAPASHIAMWDGSVWSTFGSGANADVFALAASGNTLFAGGYFTVIGGMPANRIARWDGSSWFALGSGTDSEVDALAVSGSDLYAGGQFTAAGGVPVSHIARWDGTSWNALGSGLNNAVNSIVTGGSDVYVGGVFTTASGVPASHVAGWDGSVWFPLGSGTDDYVSGISINAGALYAGGHFTNAGGVPASRIADYAPLCNLSWNVVPSTDGGTNWNDLVDAAAISPNAVWAVGSYANFNPDIPPLPLIERWNGSTWVLSPSPVTTSGQLSAVAGTKVDDVWAVGDYDAGVGRRPLLLHWTGSTWSIAPPPAINVPVGGVHDVATVSSTDAWAVGSYAPGTSPAQALAMHWDGSSWTQMAVPAQSSSNSLRGLAVVSSTDIWAVGEIGTGSPLFLHWDGHNWTQFSNPVAVTGVLYRASAVAANDIWAVGYRTDGSGLPLTMHYNGTSWSVVATPYLCCNQQLTDVQAISANNVWSVSENAFLHWNGSAWSLVSGPNPPANTNYYLEGLTATAANDVWAVGHTHSAAEGSFDGTLIEHYSALCPPPPPIGTPTDTPNPLFSPTPSSTSTPSPAATDYVVVASTGTIVPGSVDIGNHCDDCTTNISMPFPATLYEGHFFSAVIGSNGTLGFVSNGNDFTNDCVPTQAANFAILPYWDDLTTDTGSCANCGIFTSVSGSSPNRKFNIEWRAVHYGTLVPVNFEVRLYEGSGRFDIIYGQVDQAATETIGVQRDTGSLFTRILCQATGPSSASHSGQSSPNGWIISEGVVLGFGPPPARPTPTVCPIQFPDAPPGSTFYPFIHCLACLGILNGFPDGSFRPNSNVTRGQLSKIVANSAGFSDQQPSQMFQDVSLGSTFQLYIGRLASRGYIGGYACGGTGEPCVPPANLPYFRPNNNATRGQISKIVSNSAGFSDPPSGQQFQDVPTNNAFYTYIYRLVSSGVMSGYPCGGTGEPCVPPGNLPYFRPNNNATRGQTAKIVSNTFYPDCNARAR
jgi:hypothetical protein